MSRSKKKKRKKRASPKRHPAARKRTRKARSLSGIEAATGLKLTPTQKQVLNTAGLMTTGFLASIVGASFGDYSLVTGLPLAAYGFYKNKPYLGALGMGLILSNGYKVVSSATASPASSSLQGFDMKQIADGAKERVKTFLSNFKDKLIFTKSEPQTPPVTAVLPVSGLNGSTSYFLNPYRQQAINPPLDFSALDRINDQIKARNGQSPQASLKGMLDLDDISSRNF